MLTVQMLLATVTPTADALVMSAILMLAVILLVQRRSHARTRSQLRDETAARVQNERRATEISALVDTTNLLNLHVDESHLLGEACRRLSVVLGSPITAILLLSADGTKLEVAAQTSELDSDLGELEVAVGEGLLGRIVRYGKGVSIASAQLEDSGHLGESPLRQVPHVVAVPLRVKTNVLGAIVVGCEDDPAGTERLPALTMFAESLGWIIDRRQRVSELEVKAKRVSAANRRLVESNRKGEIFLATATHELRTPLSGIVSYAEVLAEYYDTMSDEERRPLCNDLNTQCQTMMGLVDELFDFARLESGRMTLDLQETNIGELVHAALDVIESRALDREIKLDRRVDAATVFRLDATKVRQCVLNLLSNALKFTEPGGTIGVSVVEVDDGVDIQVSDTGRGIEAEELEGIFQLYRSTAGRKSPGEKGLGLGLYLVKSFVELHGGSISVKSEVGIGSTFRFFLPVNARAEGSAPEQAKAA